MRRGILCLTLAAVTIHCGIAQAQSPAKKGGSSDRESLIGAWHLVSLLEPGPDGRPSTVPGLEGSLTYTRDGHMSVQIMYPKSQASLSNDYVLNGYEASFGSYEINEAAHTLTHHVQGSITPGLVGKDLTRVYHLSGRRLTVNSTRLEEHWSVIWEHY